MTGRDKKEQLGARVTPGVRQRCVDAAKQAGLSLNAWVERALMAALHTQHIETAVLHGSHVEGQTTVDDFVGEDTVAGVRASPTKPLHDVPGLEERDPLLHQAREAFRNGERVTRAAPKTFATDCSMATYHWRCSPGNPCRRCGGEA